MMRSPLRAIFFDAGNTLIFPRLPDLAADLNTQGYPVALADFYAAERAGKEKLDAWLAPQISSGQVPRSVDHVYWNEYLDALAGRLHLEGAARERLVDSVTSAFKDVRFWSEVQADTHPTLDQLRERGYYLGVISNSNGALEQQLVRLGLARHFDAVLDSFLVGVEKPHPEIFQAALERAHVTGAEAAFVGDTYATDVCGARLSGLHGVLMDRTEAYAHRKQALDCPRVTCLPELVPVLSSE